VAGGLLILGTLGVKGAALLQRALHPNLAGGHRDARLTSIIDRFKAGTPLERAVLVALADASLSSDNKSVPRLVDDEAGALLKEISSQGELAGAIPKDVRQEGRSIAAVLFAASKRKYDPLLGDDALAALGIPGASDVMPLSDARCLELKPVVEMLRAASRARSKWSQNRKWYWASAQDDCAGYEKVLKRLAALKSSKASDPAG
jgi:hypothetical protein